MFSQMSCSYEWHIFHWWFFVVIFSCSDILSVREIFSYFHSEKFSHTVSIFIIYGHILKQCQSHHVWTFSEKVSISSFMDIFWKIVNLIIYGHFLKKCQSQNLWTFSEAVSISSFMDIFWKSANLILYGHFPKQCQSHHFWTISEKVPIS